MLTTRIRPTSGRAQVAGVDIVAEPARARRALAVVPQRNNLDRSLTVRQNLRYHAAYHGVRRVERNPLADEMIGLLGLDNLADSRVDLMSGGQAQRVMIARSLMHRPRVLFLDEPVTGLDPQSRLFVHERVAQLRSQGVTVVLTTHDMDVWGFITLSPTLSRAVYAARSYSLISPPRTGRRLTRSWARSTTGRSDRGGCHCSDLCGRRPL